MKGWITFAWRNCRGMLPYPDLPRRWWVRRAARRLITCTRWPGDDATGAEVAQLAMYRMLWLQVRTRRAAIMRRREEAAFLARAALETCFIGLYCLFSPGAVGKIAAANYRGLGRSVSFLTTAGLVSEGAIDAAVAALGETGRDLNIRDVTDELARDYGLTVAAELYSAYYIPLSHLIVHANGFAFMRHVRRDGTLRARPDYPWARCPAARLADACTGLLAGNLASRTGGNPDLFLRYGQAHGARMIAPGAAALLRGLIRPRNLVKVPRAAWRLIAMRAYIDRDGSGDDPTVRERRIREAYNSMLAALGPNPPVGMFTQAVDEAVASILRAMEEEPGDTPPPPPESA